MSESLHSDRGSIGLSVEPLDIGSQTVIYVLCLLFFNTFMFIVFFLFVCLTQYTLLIIIQSYYSTFEFVVISMLL